MSRHPGRPAQPRTTRTRKKQTATLASLAISLSLGLTAAGLTALASPAQAAVTPVVKPGDIVTGSSGNVIDGGTVDKFDPVTGVRTRIASGFEFPETVVSDAAGNVYVGGRFDGLVRVDHVTGTKELLVSEGIGLQPTDMALGPDGNLIIANSTFVGTELVSFDPTTRARGAIDTTTTFSSDVTGLAIEFDGSILVLDRGRDALMRVKANTHQATLVTGFAEGSDERSLTLNKFGDPLVRLKSQDGKEQLVRVNRLTGAKTVLASTSSGLGFSTGMARAADGTILSAEADIDSTEEFDKIVRFAANGGTRSTLATVGWGEAKDLTIIGVDQILPTPLPVARPNTYSFEPPDTDLHVLPASGVLLNDSDPAYDQGLAAELVTQSTHGFVSFYPTGEFYWFPPTGYLGTDSFTYRVRTTDGRVSAPATVTLKALPDQHPVAKNDFFLSAAGRTLFLDPAGVLANDTDPQGDVLKARRQTNPSHGTLSLALDGGLSYTANPGFVGEDSFTYKAEDGSNHVSETATVTISVPAPTSNNAPSVGATKGGTLGSDGLSGTFQLGVFDFETVATNLVLTATSSNTALVPNANLVLGGTGAFRTLAVKAVSGVTGTAVVTVKVTDGAGAYSTFRITVKIGTANAETITGSDGSDLLLGLGAGDTLLGNNGNDLLSGGAGNDTMTGGAGTDSFRGGAGTNTVTDFNAAGGELVTEASTVAP